MSPQGELNFRSSINSITHYAALPQRYGVFYMKCDICKKKNQGRYSFREIEYKEGKKKSMWICWECLDGKPTKGRTDEQLFEHISTPFWVHAGLKPNTSEKAKLHYMKQHNMTWGDLRKERDAQYAKSPSGLKAMEEYKKHGAPEINFRKNS